VYATCSVHLILLDVTIPTRGILCYLPHFQANEGLATEIRFSPLPSLSVPISHSHFSTLRPRSQPDHSSWQSDSQSTGLDGICGASHLSAIGSRTVGLETTTSNKKWLRNRSNILWQSVTKFGNELRRSFVKRRDADYTGYTTCASHLCGFHNVVYESDTMW